MEKQISHKVIKTINIVSFCLFLSMPLLMALYDEIASGFHPLFISSEISFFELLPLCVVICFIRPFVFVEAGITCICLFSSIYLIVKKSHTKWNYVSLIISAIMLVTEIICLIVS